MVPKAWVLLFWLWIGAVTAFADSSGLQPNEGYIGCSLGRTAGSDFLTAEYVAAGSPAYVSGIKQGDIITSINGVSTKGMTVEEAGESIKGVVGGAIRFGVHRAGLTDEEIPVVRQSLLDTYSSAAKGGDPRAEFYLGYFYELGPIPTRRLSEAAEWYRKAAGQGYAHAQGELAYMLRVGYGIPQDKVTAAGWYLKAARQGDVVAERELAYCYLKGEGIAQSDRDAFAWFYSAAKLDDPIAEENLALLYGAGRGVKRDDQSAFDWHYRSAQLNDSYGAWGVAYMYRWGLGVGENPTEALKWYEKAQVGLPQNEKLKSEIASVKAFLEFRPFFLLVMGIVGCYSIVALLIAKLPDPVETRFLKVAGVALLLGCLLGGVGELVPLSQSNHRLLNSFVNMGFGGCVGALICLKVYRKAKPR